MAAMIKRIQVTTSGQGLYEVTPSIVTAVERQIEGEGLCTLFVRHTSCSLLIQENADPSARVDLENWMNRLVPENDNLYTHIYEGADDMPAHIKSMLTATQVSIPYQNSRLLLGTWQGVYLWEHRHKHHEREIILHISN